MQNKKQLDNKEAPYIHNKGMPSQKLGDGTQRNPPHERKEVTLS